MKKKSSWILSLVSFLLIAAAIVGIFFLIKNIDKAFDSWNSAGDTNDTNKGNVNTDTGDDDLSPGETEGNMVVSKDYFDESTQTGYITESGITYFIFAISNSNCNASGCTNTFSRLDPYNAMELAKKYCIERDDGYTEMRPFDSSVPCIGAGKVYVAYTAIVNCARPDLIYQELLTNVFNADGNGLNSNFIQYYHDVGLG